MKKILLLTLTIFGSFFASAQDTLIKKSGEEILVKVLEITPDLVKYKRFDNPEGPVISTRKSDLFLLRYANGAKEVFNEPASGAKPIRQAPAEPLYIAPHPDELAPEQIKLNGPRIGLTLIAEGELSRKLDREFEASRLLTQFGWQFETQIFMSDRGTSGLLELIPLIGGLEQGLFLPSISGIIGLRGKSGFEVGVGPNVSLAGAGLVFATGATIKSGNMNYPLNFAFVPSKEGARYSFMVGFNYRKKNQ
ncbi:hypothetical protein I5M27_15245 [Adhaeribacter sp. BT258]|uniref:MetA-pathway of phenol degradation n=1 Tax=Adhaeribacter terrigena TaxID=2793070 RepID=A0ABS1C4M2_9BACT|nr:hypothetical protein [Adhaeribacter terrigena]MBK0404352.1 hypothetical protein [Adhaeribacter terrigena]